MNDELGQRIAALEAEIARLKQFDAATEENLKKLFKNDEIFVNELRKISETFDKLKNGTINALQFLEEYIEAITAVQLTLLQALFVSNAVDRELVCSVLRMLQETADPATKPHFSLAFKAYVNICEKVGQPVDAGEVFEKARPHLRIVDENYSPDGEV